MSAEAKTETIDILRGILIDTATAVKSAKEDLGKAADAAYNAKISDEINVEYKSLESFMVQLTQAQAIADSDLLAGTTRELKLRAASFPSVVEQVKKIASYTNTPNQASVYMQQAISYIMLAEGLMAKLP